MVRTCPMSGAVDCISCEKDPCPFNDVRKVGNKTEENQ